ncbi:MAG: hypothetical protein ACREM8_14120 [Vulcanimicrobiaceae bacterium]
MDARAIRAGIAELETLYADLIRAYVPPNPQFEVERIITALPNRREIVFMLGLLNEGENEAALLLDLVDRTLTADPNAVTAHILDEAWYYLRTSIDPQWQPDDRPASARAAILYLLAILRERRDRLGRLPARPLLANADPGHRALLEGLRADLNP